MADGYSLLFALAVQLPIYVLPIRNSGLPDGSGKLEANVYVFS